jgi:hypothetical protein
MAHKKSERRALAKVELRRRWIEWLETTGGPLLSIGLPEEILSDEDHWADFCTHGRLHMHSSTTRFTAADIPKAKAQLLFAFLNQTLTPEDKSNSALYQQLVKRLA